MIKIKLSKNVLIDTELPELTPDFERGKNLTMEDFEKFVGYQIRIIKAQAEKRYTFGIVYKASSVTETPETDAHNEFVLASELQESLWEYVRSGDRRVYIQHGLIEGIGFKEAGEWVEIVSWPSEAEFELSLPGQPVRKTKVPAGSVYMGVIWKPWAWELVKQGKIRGFSFGGLANRVQVRA